jgi:predicted phosphodiesterase
LKIALLTDTHWGIRNDNISFLDNNKKFLDAIFFPTLDSLGITDVIHLGDLVDRRKYINFHTAKRMREDFLDPLASRNISMHIIAGNHDVYFKNTNSVNALSELLGGKYDNVTWLTEVTTVSFDGTSILLLPWINDENRQTTMGAIRDSKASIVAGHLELAGFEMFKGSVSSHGESPDVFNKFDTVFSGHYHHKSSSGNIMYLGSHAEFTWSDYDDPRGFHIFDTQTREITFIRNTFTMFEKLWYNDADKTMDEILNIDFEKYKNKIVKVIVTNKTNPYWFDMFVEKLEKENPTHLQIVEDHLNLVLEEDSDIVDEAESTISIFNKYIDQINIPDHNKVKLQQTIQELYNEALTVE